MSMSMSTVLPLLWLGYQSYETENVKHCNPSRVRFIKVELKRVEEKVQGVVRTVVKNVHEVKGEAEKSN